MADDGGRRFPVTVSGLGGLVAGDRPVVFHGVNKTASLTMANVLLDAYHDDDRANQCFVTYRGFPGHPERMRRLINHSRGHSLFVAHYLYGAVEPPGPHLLVTQFRHPLPRVRSCYHWIRNKAAERGESYPGFEEWVRATRGVAHSQVVQLGSGFLPGNRLREPGLTADELLERAIPNIERDVDWFGIAEYFEESAFVMAGICGLPSVGRWQSDGRNQGRPLVDDWAPGEAELVREVFAADFTLYEWALARFTERIRGLGFDVQLAAYKRACSGQYKDRLHPDGTPIAPDHSLVDVAATPGERPSGGRWRRGLKRGG